ncbi:hypothetical protein ACFFRR_002399 [Megaselia abdita]
MRSVFLVCLLSVILNETIGFDRNIAIENLTGCIETRLDDKNNNKWNVPISSLKNNKPGPNESLRMRFYAIGYDFYIYFKKSDEIRYPIAAYINGAERKWCKIQSFTYEQKDLTTVGCSNRTNVFDYTDFTLVLTKNGVIKFFEGKSSIPFISADVYYNIPFTHLGFGKYPSEKQDTRFFFDCPWN